MENLSSVSIILFFLRLQVIPILQLRYSKQDQKMYNIDLMFNIDVVFQSVIISRLCCALSPVGRFLKSDQITRVYAFCSGSVRDHITTRLTVMISWIKQIVLSFRK